MTNNIYSEKEISDDLYNQLKIMETQEDLKLREFQNTENSDEEEHEFDDEEEEEEEEFSFASVGDDAAAISAEHAFSDGQIKAVFPLFDQSLLLSGDGDLPENLPTRPPVKKVFVETSDDQIAGPYCEWSSRKAVEAAPESCKKSNSTGFSKIWRLKEITCRSNSDGRDAFVFLNGNHAPPSTAPVDKAAAPPPETVKKSGKEKEKKKKTVSPHEAYLRSKAKDEERQRRSYLPYRPELMGFFTNVNGGLTRNVHPF
ncbi:uncharacterized protein LOC125206790 [Salvia hispanica]|uniref:uncharacterized protein LOC125206790 n=1 Tax=Salvia hispanica TaxID=49212 RepID=UPI002008FAEB|nr:uncharacterized protein LOC125206790 [Salvia hispanica]